MNEIQNMFAKLTNLEILKLDKSKRIFFNSSNKLSSFKEEAFSELIQKEDLIKFIKNNNIIGIVENTTMLAACRVEFIENEYSSTIVKFIETDTGQPYYKNGHVIYKYILTTQFIKG